MLFGVLRWKQARLMGGIWRLMYQQGLLWVVVVTLADVPPTIFILLNLNEPMDRMFMIPSMIIMSVGALRMYRGLVDSAALNYTMVVEPAFSSKGLSAKSDIQFAVASELRTDCREEEKDTRSGATGPALDSNYLPTAPQRIVFIANRDDGAESLESEAV